MTMVRRYRAESVSSALKMVKADLGSDAVILRTRRVRPPGLIGWFQQPQLEVAAAADSGVRHRVQTPDRVHRLEPQAAAEEAAPTASGEITAVEPANEHRPQPLTAYQEQLTQLLARLEQDIARLTDLRAELLASLRQDPRPEGVVNPGDIRSASMPSQEIEQ